MIKNLEFMIIVMTMENYKENLIKWIEEKTRIGEIKYVVPIVEKLLASNKKGKKGNEKYVLVIKKTKERLEIKRDEIENRIIDICNFIVKKSVVEGYNALGIPCIISFDQAPNFYVVREKPTEEEIWWWLYHILTGIHSGDIIINLLNVSSEVREGFRDYLKDEGYFLPKEGFNLQTDAISNRYKIRKSIIDAIIKSPFALAFLILTFFVDYWREKKELGESHRVEIVGDETSLIIFTSLGKKGEKKKVFLFPRVSKIINKWYSDIIEKGDTAPSILNFLFSFVLLGEKKYRELSMDYLNKFCYYLLKEKVSGEILSRLTELKVEYELNNLKERKKANGVSRGKFFFSKLE